MKIKSPIKIISLCLAVVLCVSLFALVGREDGTAPTGQGYKWTFGGSAGVDLVQPRAGYWEEKGESDANGYNKLTFAWDYNTSNEMVFAVTNPLISDNCQFIAPNGSSNYHTYMEVLRHTDSEKADDDHWAMFESMSSFNTPQAALANHQVYAVTPIITEGTDANESAIQSSADEFWAALTLPGSFHQPESERPDFLHNYMYMSATATLDETGNVAGGLQFQHIPATFRFKVTNKSGEPVHVDRISVSTTNSKGIAPKQYWLQAKAGTEGFATLYDDLEGHSSVVVHNYDSGEKLANNDTYTGYMLLFPGVEFADTDEINITAVIDGTEQTVLAITGAQLKATTTSNKLLSGNLYTFNLKYEVGLSLTGITVSDWTEAEEEITAPIATEWVNGFSENGECQPAKLNADGQYRIGNAGNLVWFANQVNSGSSTDIEAVLTADIDMSGARWTPIGSTTAYTGTFDGNGYSIKNIAITAVGTEKTTYAGLFGILGGTVQNLDVSGTLSLNSNGSTGGIAGELVDGGSIINVLSDIDITAVDGATIASAYVGGVVGKLTKGSISRCTYAGDIKLGSVDIDQSGGIVGYIDYNNSNAKSITDCAFTGSISTDITGNSIGGILGYSRSSALTLARCLSVGTVSGPTGCTASAIGTINEGPASISTLYYLEGSAPTGYCNSGEYTYATDAVRRATATELSDGTVTTALGEKWTQGMQYPELIRTIE